MAILKDHNKTKAALKEISYGWQANENKVLELVNQGVDVNKKSFKMGLNLLQFACQFQMQEVVKTILEQYPNVDPNLITTDNKESTLSIAVKNSSLDTVKRLVQMGADVNLKDKYGSTPLTTAIKANRMDNVDYLLSLPNIDINSCDLYKENALMVAIAWENEKLAKNLIDMGADIYIENVDGNTPLMMALQNKLESVAEKILEKVKLDNGTILNPEKTLQIAKDNGQNILAYNISQIVGVEVQNNNNENNITPKEFKLKVEQLNKNISELEKEISKLNLEMEQNL